MRLISASDLRQKIAFLRQRNKPIFPSIMLLSITSKHFARVSCRSYVTSRTLLDKIIIAVPRMGDSITEGTIVEWATQVGQPVKTDDVVALIETDKVTVEIKATQPGVITQHFGEV